MARLQSMRNPLYQRRNAGGLKMRRWRRKQISYRQIDVTSARPPAQHWRSRRRVAFSARKPSFARCLRHHVKVYVYCGDNRDVIRRRCSGVILPIPTVLATLAAWRKDVRVPHGATRLIKRLFCSAAPADTRNDVRAGFCFPLQHGIWFYVADIAWRMDIEHTACARAAPYSPAGRR